MTGRDERRRAWRRLCAAAAVAVVAGISMGAQRVAPRPPNPLGQPLIDQNGFPRDDAMIRVPLLPEDKQYADLDGFHMKEIVKEIAAISLRDRDRGELFWGRNMGFPGHVEMENWVERYFQKNGLGDIRRKVLDLDPQWVPHSYDITFTGGGRPFTLNSARPAAGTRSTPPGGLDLELVWVATGTAADFIGRDVRGKAVLIQDIPTPGTANASITKDGALTRAFDNGAAAVGLVYGIADNLTIWEGLTGQPAGFHVGFEDGKVLRDRLGTGERVRVKYRLDSEMRPNLKTAAVLGTLPGATDEEILLIAHIDGYFQGALDNASGVSVMMNLLEHYAKIPQAKRRRTIRFLGSAGHHSNSGAWLPWYEHAGGPGTAWLHDARQTEFAKSVLLVNLEHVAANRTKYWGTKLRKTTAVSPMRWWVYGSSKVLDISLKAFTRFNVGITADMESDAAGEMGWVGRDAPSIGVITSPEIKHAEEDTPEWVPAVGLEQIARAYAKIIDDVNKLDRNDIVPMRALPQTPPR